MKLSKLLLAVVAASVLLGAFVSTASARNLSTSEQRQQILWRRMDFSGGFGGTVECEVLLSGSLHSRTIPKTVGLLIGYITEGTVLRCARGSATIIQSSFPWHRRYAGFVGTLPTITSTSETVRGAEYIIREPGGITCEVNNAENRAINTISARAISRVEVSGESTCGGFFPGRLIGSETNVVNNLVARSRITVTLI